MENIKHCDIAIGLLYISNQEKKQQSLRFKFAEVKNHLRLRKCKKLPQTYRKLAVADRLLLFCGCGIEFKFAMPSTGNIAFDYFCTVWLSQGVRRHQRWSVTK